MPENTRVAPPPIRVTIQQPALPHYRVPVFRLLATRPDISLRVVYGGDAALPNVDPDGFEARFEPMATRTVLGQSVIWCGSQLRYASRSNADVLVLSRNTRYLSLVSAQKDMLRVRSGCQPSSCTIYE